MEQQGQSELALRQLTANSFNGALFHPVTTDDDLQMKYAATEWPDPLQSNMRSAHVPSLHACTTHAPITSFTTLSLPLMQAQWNSCLTTTDSGPACSGSERNQWS